MFMCGVANTCVSASCSLCFCVLYGRAFGFSVILSFALLPLFVCFCFFFIIILCVCVYVYGMCGACAKNKEKIRDQMLRKMQGAVSKFATAKKQERKQLGTKAFMQTVADALDDVEASKDHLKLSEEVNVCVRVCVRACVRSIFLCSRYLIPACNTGTLFTRFVPS